MRPEMEELQREIGERVQTLSEDERLKVSKLMLRIVQCFGPAPEAEAALVCVTANQLEIVGVGNESSEAKTLNLFCTAHEVLHDQHGVPVSRAVH